jgi:hypothetical protein
MFEPGVVCTGVDEVRKSQLPDIAQPLERGGVEEIERIVLDLNIAMDRVLDDLHRH